MMMSRLEHTLGLLPGTVSQSQSLADLVEKNGALVFARAFRIPLPFSTSYTRKKFREDLSIASQPETSQNREAIAKAKQNLAYHNQAIKDRIGQINSAGSYWWASEEESSKTREITEFQQGIKQIDLLLYLPEGSTKKFLSGEISLNDYIDIGAKKESNLRYILKESTVVGAKITQLTHRLAEQLGLEAGTNYFTAFVNQMSILIDWGTNNPGDRSAISGQENLFQPEKQILKIFSLVADQEAGLDPGTFGRLLYASASQRTFLLIEAGMRYLQNQLGLEDKIQKFFKYYGIYQDCRDRPFSTCFSTKYAISLVSKIIIDRAHLNPGNSRHRSFARHDASLLINGDTRILLALGAANLIDGLLDPQQVDNPVRVPTKIAPDYFDFRYAFAGNPDDQEQIQRAGEAYAAKMMAVEDQATIMTLEDDLVLVQEGRRKKEAQLRRGYQKNLHYKLSDSLLYKADQHIPAGFTQKMMEADENGKAAALADLALNYIGDDSLFGAIFANDPKTRDAVIAYIKDPSGETASKIAIDGFTAVEGFLNTRKVFGNIKIERVP
jgi:hypothetical protein